MDDTYVLFPGGYSEPIECVSVRCPHRQQMNTAHCPNCNQDYKTGVFLSYLFPQSQTHHPSLPRGVRGLGRLLSNSRSCSRKHPPNITDEPMRITSSGTKKRRRMPMTRILAIAGEHAFLTRVGTDGRW